MSLTRQELFERFVADLATVIGALIETPAFGGPSTSAPEGGWIVTMQAEQAVRGVLVVEFDRNAIEALTKRVMGMEVEPSAEVVVDTLKEVCAQAAGSMVQEPPLNGTRLTITSVDRVGTQATPDPVLMQIAVGGVATLPLRLWGTLTYAAPQKPNVQTPAAPDTASPASPAPANPKLDVILDIDLPLLVRFGRTEMPLRSLTMLGPGSVIDLGRSPDDPVDVLVSNQVVARGEVVIVGGNYGVRITDVMSPADRMRSMEVEL